MRQEAVVAHTKTWDNVDWTLLDPSYITRWSPQWLLWLFSIPDQATIKKQLLRKQKYIPHSIFPWLGQKSSSVVFGMGNVSREDRGGDILRDLWDGERVRHPFWKLANMSNCLHLLLCSYDGLVSLGLKHKDGFEAAEVLSLCSPASVRHYGALTMWLSPPHIRTEHGVKSILEDLWINQFINLCSQIRMTQRMKSMLLPF